MSNIIDKIQLSGVTYDIGGQGGSGVSVVEVTQAGYDALPTSAKTDTSKMYVITDAEAGDLTNYYTKTETNTLLGGKQATLVSGTNIKTINNESILGNGNIDIQGSGGKAVTGGTNISVTTGETADTINCTLPITVQTQSQNYDNLLLCDSSSNTFAGNKTSNNIIFGSNNSIGSAFDASKKNIIIGDGNTINQGFGGSNPSFNFFVGDYNNIGKNYAENASHTAVFGTYLTPKNSYEYAFGKYNNSVTSSTTWGDSGNTLFSVGNGTSSARHNAFEIRQNGDIYLTKDGQDVKLQDQLGGGGSSYTAGDGIDITNDVISVTGKVDTTTYNTYTAATDAALATKQTTLTAGTNITIIDNVISATGGGGGGVTIDPTLDSGSTNPVANSAITEAVLVPSYMGLIEVQNDVAFPNATALYVEKTGSRDSCYIQASLSGESSVEDLIFIESFTAHTFEQEPSYVDYQWVDDALILTPKTSGNYFYKAEDVWGNLKISTIDNYSSGSSSSVIQNEIYPRIDEINNKLNTIKDIFTTEISFDPIYHDYGGYWRYDLIWKNNTGNTYTYYINKLRYNDFGYDDGIIFVKKTSGATSGSTDCITSGGVYEQMGGMKIVKLTQSAYDALSPNYDSNTLYVIVN